MTLKELLNLLIQMGWKPRGYESIKMEYACGIIYYYTSDNSFMFSLRDLVSIESGLWQFVCENNLLRNYSNGEISYWARYLTEIDGCKDNGPKYKRYHPYYWILSSSIQENIERFLLYNILLPTK